MSCEDTCTTDRMPPLAPDTVRRMLGSEKVFTNESDVDTVADLYETFFTDISSAAERVMVVDSVGVKRQSLTSHINTATLDFTDIPSVAHDGLAHHAHIKNAVFATHATHLVWHNLCMTKVQVKVPF